MQYILTEEEYNKLVPKKHLEEANGAIYKLGSKLLKATETKCVYATDYGGFGYCDQCPLSKAANDWSDASKLFCKLAQQYGK